MTQILCSFNNLTPETYAMAGGKGATLAKLYQKGYPVPDGFIVFPSAFSDDHLIPEAWDIVKKSLDHLRKSNHFARTFAVRSSSALEDSSHASFAGGFDTVLNVSTDESIKEAIQGVYLSRKNERVKTYSQAYGIDFDNAIAVIVQKMVPSDISGVMFTADPVSGDQSCMTGNFVNGFGDQLVSGEVDGQSFHIKRPKGEYVGPKELKRFSNNLYELAVKLEKELALPQDIEWALAANRLYLLQSRPITTALRCNPATCEKNDSFGRNFLWSNVNFGEAIPDVMTPFTASALEYGPAANLIKFKGHTPYGTICGRPYLNISVMASIYSTLGKNNQQIHEILEDMALSLPKDLKIPLIQASKATLFSVVPQLISLAWRQLRDLKRMPSLVSINKSWCNEMQQIIEQVRTGKELVSLWEDRIKPHLLEVWSGLLSSANYYSGFTSSLQRELVKEVGPDDADALISGMSSESHLLASLGPLIGISKVSRGTMSSEEYMERYGHRGSHELELSAPRPSEESGWLDHQVINCSSSTPDIEKQLCGQQKKIEAAWNRFRDRCPHKEKSVRKRICEVAKRARLREEVRSEYTRVFGIWRKWALQAGSLSGVGQNIFFLTVAEVLVLLNRNNEALRHIPSRKEAYERYKALPQYPTVINGHFDPFQWALDPNRRYDYFDSHSSAVVTSTNTITGTAGSAGRVEGVVRCISTPEEGGQLQPGEILVTSQTNIGWTLCFPKAAAIITDVGAPLSHAAIVAREMGIPAVVGCGNATILLKTGDRVKVDGARGVVEILSE
jgi:phosphohistidine swiveling domain-containing protein